MSMRMTWYTVVVLIVGLAAALGWTALKHQRHRDPGRFPYFQRSYLLFIIFSIGLLVLLLVVASNTSANMIYQGLGVGSLTLLVLLLVLPIVLASLRLERRVRSVFAIRLVILVLCVALPLLVYRTLVENVDEFAVAVAVLVSAIAAVCLLAWELYKHRKNPW